MNTSSYFKITILITASLSFIACDKEKENSHKTITFNVGFEELKTHQGIYKSTNGTINPTTGLIPPRDRPDPIHTIVHLNPSLRGDIIVSLSFILTNNYIRDIINQHA